MDTVTTNGAAPANRLDRRKARTRQALVDAAARLIAEGRGERASIQEITDAADIGFGSFYNHFVSKEELFQTASEEVLERWAQVIDAACAGLDDPAEVFAISLRISGRLAWTHPEIAAFITGAGLDLLDTPRGLAPAPCVTSAPARPPAASPSRTPRSRSAPSPADSSASFDSTRSTPNGSLRPLSTNLPRRACASSASPPPRPGASPDSASPTRAGSAGHAEGDEMRRNE